MVNDHTLDCCCHPSHVQNNTFLNDILDMQDPTAMLP